MMFPRASAQLVSARLIAARLPLAALLLLSGCFDMPHPFAHPGKATQDLALHPPPSRLDIPAPTDVGLKPAASDQWAKETVAALLDQTVPAIEQPSRPGDWWLKLHVEKRGPVVVPLYTVMTPKGTVRATQEGPPVPAALWASATPELMKAVAHDAAPRIVTVLTGIEAEVMDQDPHSLMHRASRIWFKGVSGAPGDGNISLAQSFVVSLRDDKDAVQNTVKDSDFSVGATVKLSNGPAGTRDHPQQHIEIAWRVLDKDGKEVGIATQLHDIDAHSLDGMWGDVAMAAGAEAAGGVKEMISRYSGRNVTPLPPPGGKPGGS